MHQALTRSTSAHYCESHTSQLNVSARNKVHCMQGHSLWHIDWEPALAIAQGEHSDRSSKHSSTLTKLSMSWCMSTSLVQ